MNTQEKTMGEQMSFLEPISKAIHGAEWFAGNWQCRNHNGYLQSRESGRGLWKYTIYAFGDDDCLVYAINADGELTHVLVPIDGKDRITIHGRKYGRDHWQH